MELKKVVDKTISLISIYRKLNKNSGTIHIRENPKLVKKYKRLVRSPSEYLDIEELKFHINNGFDFVADFDI